MNTNDPKQTTMVCERYVGTLPSRAADATWRLVVRLIAECVKALGGDAVTLALEELEPVATYLLLMHSLESGSVEFCSAALNVVFRFRYGAARPDDELSLPPIAALPRLPVRPQFRLVFRVSSELPLGLTRIIQRVNAGGRLRVEVVSLTRHDPQPERSRRPEFTNKSLGILRNWRK